MSGGEVVPDLPLTRAVAGSLTVVPTTGSTNSDLVDAASRLPDFAVVATFAQRAGRGRQGRVWQAPEGETLAASVLIRPTRADGTLVPTESWGWFPLLAGVALKRVLAELLPERPITLKWPNDVQIDGLKVSGLLAEMVWDDGRPSAVVMGSGINLTIPEEDLPTPTSTSLMLQGATGTAASIADRVYSAYLGELRTLTAALAADADLSDVVAAECDTVGRAVRVELPGGEFLRAVATGLDDDGRLVVREDESGRARAIAAGDVTHLRYE